MDRERNLALCGHRYLYSLVKRIIGLLFESHLLTVGHLGGNMARGISHSRKAIVIRSEP